MTITLKDRAEGAILGAFIGDGLGVGPHWYYNLDELRAGYGEWIDDYTDPKPGRYHSGLKAGQLSQSGFILSMMLRSLIDCGTYDETDFCKRLDRDLFPLLDGTPESGPGGYCSQSIREVWQQRVVGGRDWEGTGSHADTTEAIERTLAIAVRYATRQSELTTAITSNTMLTQTDETVVSMTVAFGTVLSMLIQGHALDDTLSGKLMQLVKSGELPFHSITSENLQPPTPGAIHKTQTGQFASPDALLTPSYMATAAADSGIKIEPAWKVSLVYGMPCAIYHQLPAAYYLASRFENDFEAAVLHAINGGGQNQARAMLTGCLVGAQVGLSNIPERFVKGLESHAELLGLAAELATQVPIDNTI